MIGRTRLMTNIKMAGKGHKKKMNYFKQLLNFTKFASRKSGSVRFREVVITII